MDATDPSRVHKILGAAFFTFVVGCVLYGITLSQVHQYFKMYPDDTRILKTTVILVWLIDTLHSALSIHMMWSWLVKGIGPDLALAEVIWSIKGVGYLHVFMMLFVQGIYLSRIYLFTKKSIDVGRLTSVFLRVAVVFGGVLALAAVAVFLMELQIVTFLLDFAHGAKWILFFAFGATCIVDIGITVGMCSVLNKSKIKIRGVQLASNVVLSKIIIFFISSGLLTTIIAVTYMALYAALPDILLFIGATFSTSKLYANSVLAMINARRHLRSEFVRPRDIEMVSSMRFQVGATGDSDTSMANTSVQEKRGRSFSDAGSLTKRSRRGSI